MKDHSLLVEKYRPDTLDNYVGNEHIKKTISQYLGQNDIQNLVFYGPAGTGKTTLAKIIVKNLDCDFIYINASDERGIGMVREKVKKFSGFAGLSNVPFKIIILDEADEMTSDAQTALRRIIEDTAKICRFILIANNISKIIDPIQSRCATFKFTSVGEEDIIKRLEIIAKKEKVKSSKKGLKAIYDYSQGDLRHAINLLQATASLGEISEETVTSSAGLTKTTDVDEVLKIALSGNVVESREKMIELIKVYGMSESDFLKYFNSAVFKSKHEKLSEILEVIAKYDYRILVGANSEIQLSAMLAELARIEK